MVIYRSKIKTLFISILSIFMVICGLFVLYVGLKTGNILFTGIGIFGGFFFLICMLFIIKELFNESPLLTIDEKGFVERSSALSPIRKIYWSEVKNIDIYTLLDERFISVWLNNPDEVLISNKWIDKIYNFNNMLNAGDININVQQAKGHSVEEIYEFMLECWEQSIM